jgi:hypothetical protein
MNDCTREWLNDLFGTGYHQAGAIAADKRVDAAYGYISDTCRHRIRSLKDGDELDLTDEDILGAMVDGMSDHNWRILAATLFNKKEDA